MDIETRARKIVDEMHGDPMEIARAMVKVAREHAAMVLVLKQIVRRHPELQREVRGISTLVQQAGEEQET